MSDVARLLVTGGRDFMDKEFVWTTLDRLHADINIGVVIHGDARGVDHLCRDWAIARGIEHDPYPAEWDKTEGVAPCDIGYRHGRQYNKRAGFERNQRMLDKSYPTHAAIFPGGNGTEDMARRIWTAICHGRAIQRLDYSGGRLGVDWRTGKARYA